MTATDDALERADDLAWLDGEATRRLREMPDDDRVWDIPDYMPQCAACHLGQPHTFGIHRDRIALHEVWGRQAGPWRDPRSPAVQQAIREYIAQIKSGAVVPAPDYNTRR